MSMVETTLTLTSPDEATDTGWLTSSLLVRALSTPPPPLPGEYCPCSSCRAGEPITPKALEEMDVAIARCVALMDRNIPDWLTRIEWEALNIGSSSQCIAGQLGMGYYDDGIDAMGILTGTLTHSDYGLDTKYGWDFETLTNKWKKVGHDRLSGITRATD